MTSRHWLRASSLVVILSGIDWMRDPDRVAPVWQSRLTVAVILLGVAGIEWLLERRRQP